MFVKGEGDPKSKIYFIGEAPGSNEMRQGRPFCGGAGIVLDQMLREVGIERSSCYIDNVIQTQPPGNNFKIYYSGKTPKPELLEAHRILHNKIIQHRPNVVAMLGNEALYALHGVKGVTNYRGSTLNFNGIKTIPIIHPASIMRNWEFRPLTVFDLGKIKQESRSPDLPLPYDDNFKICLNFDEAIAQLKLLETKKYVAFDIETNQEQEQILSIGFAWTAQDAICIPIYFNNYSYWTPEQELALIRQIQTLFRNTDVNFIAQNAQFDMVYLADKWGVEVKNLWMDTMIAWHCVYPELRKSLAVISSVYTRRPFYKTMAKLTLEQFCEYNMLDAVCTWESAMGIREDAIDFKTFDFYMKHSHQLIKPLIDIQRRGVKIDMELRKKMDIQFQKDEQDMLATLHRAVGYPLNPNSPKQMKEFLYEDLKLPPVYKKRPDSDAKTITADEETLVELSEKYDSPILRLVVDIRKVRKLLSTYIKMEVEKDERVRCSYVITGTETGRLSSRSNVYSRGTNLQNIPRGPLIRSLFIPDNLRKMVNADLSQAEARAVAYIAEEERLLHLFNNPSEDVHKRNASMVFKKRLEDITPQERQLAKTLVHAANYGIGETKFSRHVGISRTEARELLNKYYNIYPMIKMWHRQVQKQLSDSRIIRTPLGRARQFFGRMNDDLIRQAIAYVPQSTVSDIINLGIINSYSNIPPNWEILLQVHDSILLQVPLETPHEQVEKFIRHYFEIPISINNRTMIIPVDFKYGKNWGSMK